MRRREFIILAGGMAALPLAAYAQPGERMRRVGVLIGVADDVQGQARVAAFRKGMQELGWARADEVIE
jgi:putative ABC transport system substrate-binding protein